MTNPTDDPMARKAQADLLIERTAMQLRQLAAGGGCAVATISALSWGVLHERH